MPDADLADLLRRIVAKTDEGPRACVGFNADGSIAWKGSFDSLLDEARQALTEPVGFGISNG